MKIKKIRKLKVNSYTFTVKWDASTSGGSFDFYDRIIKIGTHNWRDDTVFMVICHELWEICACEMHCRLNRPDCSSDYIFVYDHRQHDTMTSLFASLVSQFLE